MRIRITFSKAGAMKYVGHLDLHRSWERTFRRAGLLLEYSQGFHPQPHLQLACALPLGFTSQCELLDAWLEQDYPLPQVQHTLAAALPPGLEIVDLLAVDNRSPALQTQVTSALYQVAFLDGIPDLEERIQRVATADTLPRVRRNKAYDLRPLIESISPVTRNKDGLQVITVQMATREAATGRPEELLDEMGVQFADTRVHRIALLLKSP